MRRQVRQIIHRQVDQRFFHCRTVMQGDRGEAVSFIFMLARQTVHEWCQVKDKGTGDQRKQHQRAAVGRCQTEGGKKWWVNDQQTEDVESADKKNRLQQ